MTTWLEKTNTKEVQWMEENYADIYIYIIWMSICPWPAAMVWYFYISQGDRPKPKIKEPYEKLFQRKVKVNQVWWFPLVLNRYDMCAVDKGTLIR